MTRTTAEQRATRAARRAREATFPKCKECGNVLGIERSNAGIKRCRGCLPDEELVDRDRLSKLLYNDSPKIEDKHARECVQEIIRIIARGNV